MKTFYIGRASNIYFSDHYQVGSNKKYWSNTGFTPHHMYKAMCKAYFERVTGIKLKHGQLVKVRLEVVEEIK